MIVLNKVKSYFEGYDDIQHDFGWTEFTLKELGLPTADLAVRYLLVGLVMNFIGGWITDFTTSYVEKQQKVKLSKEINLEG